MYKTILFKIIILYCNKIKINNIKIKQIKKIKIKNKKILQEVKMINNNHNQIKIKIYNKRIPMMILERI